jgi:hypothetical protein
MTCFLVLDGGTVSTVSVSGVTLPPIRNVYSAPEIAWHFPCNEPLFRKDFNLAKIKVVGVRAAVPVVCDANFKLKMLHDDTSTFSTASSEIQR